MGLNQEQQAAVDYLEGPLLVLAGPGTGKTQLLSAKVAHILQTLDVNPENILCLTFTEAGAENMRARLQSMIGKAALDANIFTYHAFGSDILERYKSYAENLDRNLATAIDDTARYKLIYDIQKSLPAMDILKDSDTKDIISTISSAKGARLAPNDLHKIASQNLEDSLALSDEISPIFLNLRPREKLQAAIDNTYQPILDILLKHSSTKPITKNVERIANVLARDLHQAIEEAAEEGSIKKLSAWKTKNFEVWTRDPKHPETKSYRLKDHIANKKLISLANIMEKYEQKLREQGLFDFDDMIQLAIHYLKTDDGFRLQLSELFQFILLDEFQDTNASQFELIKLLTDYEKPVVMAVGDDDQAIFEFQGASASNLRDYQEYYGANVITLLDNYRSTGEILDFSRKIADQVADSFAKNYNTDKNLRSMKDTWEKPSHTPQVTRHAFANSIDERVWIAHQIRDLVDQGEDPNEIAIIAPKHNNIAPILPYLKAQNLDVAYEKRDNILLDSKISQIITIAQFVQRLANREQPVEKLLEILSYDFWQIPPAVALRAVEQKWGTNKTVLEYLAGDPQLEQVALLLGNLVVASINSPLELWLDYLTGTASIGDQTSPMINYYRSHCSPAELFEFYENLATLRQKVLAHAQSVHANQADYIPRLADFIATIEDYEISDTPIMRISIYRDSNRAIQVMTSHKSKGLEYKYVFLTSVDDSSWGKSKGNNNKLSLPKNLVHVRHTGNTDDEKLRLFFVAATRAKNYLTMTSADNKEDGSTIKPLRYLNEGNIDDAVRLSPFIRPTEDEKSIHLHHGELDDAQKIEAHRLNWVSAYQRLEPDMLSLLRERMKDYRLSPTDLTGFIDIIYGGPQSIYSSRILRAPSEPANFSMCYGNVLHAVFEQVTTQGLTDEAALELFRNEAKKVILPDSERQNLIEKGEHSLKIALREFGDILRRPDAKAEVNLSSEHINFDGIPITGKIDHLEIDPQAKTIEVYDYKTGNYHDGKWDSQPSLYKYSLQLGFYKILLNLSREYRNYKVTRGHILFVSPDVNECVYDKVYDFNDQDEQTLQRLIKAVHHQLTSLDFVNDPELFIEPDKNRNMKKIKEFVTKLINYDL